MEYKNTKSGVTFSSPFVISGGDWVPVDGELIVKKVPDEEPIIKAITIDKQEESEENLVDFDGITRVQIMQELDAFGIEYDKKANKKVLYDLMMQGK